MTAMAGRRVIVAITGLAALVAGCKDHAPPPPPSSSPTAPLARSAEARVAEAPAAPPAPPAIAEMPAPVAAWTPRDAAQAWQGAWLLPVAAAPPSWAAIDVAGARVAMWDGQTEASYELIIDAPCSAVLLGGGRRVVVSFAVQDGKLVAGLGHAGYRRGAEAVACVGAGVIVLDASGTCTRWSRSDARWTSEPTRCTWRKDGDKEILTVGASGDELVAFGSVLMSEALAREHAPPFPDLAAARAGLDAERGVVADAGAPPP